MQPTDIKVRLSFANRIPVPDQWDEILKRSATETGSVKPATAKRWVAGLLATAVASAGVGFLVFAFRTSSETFTPARPYVMNSAPRQCPVGLIHESEVDAVEFERLAQGYLPTWLPGGFGLLSTFGSEGAAGSDAYGIWSDENCRLVEVAVSPAGGIGKTDQKAPRIGPWILQADVPNGCGNQILGKARCLDYITETKAGVISLAMMGLDRVEGDRVALSIIGGGVTNSP